MPKNFFYSINLLIKSDSHLEKSITSLLSDEAYFLENIQLILIDSLCSDLSLKICSEYNKKHPENIYFVDAAGKNEASAYNDARMLCAGTYILYTDNYGEYSKKTLQTLHHKTLKNGKIPILCIQPMVSPSGETPHEYVEGFPTGIIKLKETPDRFVLMLGCYFFHKRLTEKLQFDEGLPFQSDIKFIAEALLQTYSYIFMDSFCYTTNLATDHEWFKFLPQYSRAFYSQSIQELMIPLLISYPGSVLAQSVVMYLIESRFSLNADEKYKHVLIGNYVDDFFEQTSKLLKYIDDPVILNKNICRLCHLDEEMSFRLLRLKYKNPQLQPEIDLVLPKEQSEKGYYNSCGRLVKMTLSGEFVAHYHQAVVGTSREITAEIVAINYDTDGLYIDARLNHCSYLEQNDFSVFVNVNGVRSPVISSGIYTLKKHFDVPFLKRYAFRFFVPVSKGKSMDTVFLLMKYRNMSFRIGMVFEGLFSRLSSRFSNSYWNFLDRVMVYDRKTKSLVIRRATSAYLRLCENKFMSEAGSILSLTEFYHYRQLRRSVRNALTEKAEKKYLLFYDEMGLNYNGNILFRYFYTHHSTPRIELFYTARRGSNEFEYMAGEQYANLLEAGTRKAKIMALCSDLIFATDCDVYESLLFNKKDLLLLKDLFHAKILSVKNFFITYATAQFDNRLRDNTQFFFCASEKEKDHILKPIYDYESSMVRVTGYPILDTLNNEKEKLILLAPGDRRQFCIYENAEFYRFSESRFFKLFNAILIDPVLHEALRKHGYRLAVMMPYSIEKFLPLFHSDEIVHLYPSSEENETELVKKAAVLITDYSDLQYRFAYLNKPVVYYYPHSLPVQQEYKNEGLSKNSFGKLFFEHEALITHLTEGLSSGFEQPAVYEKMCQEFFRYHDTDNCKRIFQTIRHTFLSDLYGT